MTNPFLANNATPSAAPQAAPAAQAPAPAPQAAPAQNTAPVAQGAAAIGGVPSVDSADPFASPTGGGDMEAITAEVGNAVLVRPMEYIQSMNTAHGVTDAVRADWIVLTGPNQGKTVNGSLIFGKVLKSELRSIMGTPKPMMVAVIGRGEAKGGKSAPYLFAAADDATKALAAQAASAHNWI